jgi:hypothetical protein
MEFPRRARMTVGRFAWGVVVASPAASVAFMGGREAAGQDAAQDDGIPPGTVAFFAGTSCPPGWSRPDDVKGRLVVAVIDGAQVGTTVGAPLTDQENRPHRHDYSGSTQLQGLGIAGAAGSNVNGARAQSYTVQGQSDDAPSGLPFVQLLACERQ